MSLELILFMMLVIFLIAGFRGRFGGYGSRRFRHQLLGVALSILPIGLPLAVVGVTTSAQAQVSIDFRLALDPYGQSRQDPRWGEFWVPARRPRDWRPYTYGHWVYTDEWGWYWVADDAEEDFAWVVYHYGRWLFDVSAGWLWIPNDEWAPAWVDWRYSNDYVGWRPLPPDEVIYEYQDDPVYWTFLPLRYLTASRIRSYFVAAGRRADLMRSTAIVNRTFSVRSRGGRLGVDPGIAPDSIAAARHSAIRTYRVRPRVFAGTQGVSGAVQVRAEDIRASRQAGQRGRTRANATVVERTTTVIKPGIAVPAPQALGKDERAGSEAVRRGPRKGSPPAGRREPTGGPAVTTGRTACGSAAACGETGNSTDSGTAGARRHPRQDQNRRRQPHDPRSRRPAARPAAPPPPAARPTAPPSPPAVRPETPPSPRPQARGPAATCRETRSSAAGRHDPAAPPPPAARPAAPPATTAARPAAPPPPPAARSAPPAPPAPDEKK